MSHTIAIRLPTPLFKRMRLSARALKKSRSDLIRKALEDYLERMGPAAEKDPYSVLLSLMPLEASGLSDLGSQSEFHLRKKFHARSHSR